MANTNLTKAFIRSVVFLLLIAQLQACSANTEGSNDEKQPFFIGKWPVRSIHTSQYNALDDTGKKIYNEQMNALLDSSFIEFCTDSSYAMKIGPDSEKGVWIIGKDESKLVLKRQDKQITRFKISEKNGTSFNLTNIDNYDHQVILLRKD